MLYALARPLLFALDPETAHRLALQFSGLAGFLNARPAPCPVKVMGLEFPNPVGLAAGLDKNAEHVDALAALGFGFIEVGTVTPRPQPGNPRPRLFRIPEAQALVNRLGFNNVGLEAFVANLSRVSARGVVGVNIGRNFDTPNERAADDYAACLEGVYAHASYVTVNISSPNTAQLRDLQEKDGLDLLLGRLVALRKRLAARHSRRVPLALKVSPDLEAAQIRDIAATVLRHGVDAVIATNTSLSPEGIEGSRHAAEPGGVSGAPVRARATGVLAAFAAELKGEVPLIGVGGILKGADAAEKFAAGASLVQLYTGLVYRGPGLIAECVERIRVANRPAS